MMQVKYYHNIEDLISKFKVAPEELVKVVNVHRLATNGPTTTKFHSISFEIIPHVGSGTNYMLTAHSYDTKASREEIIESLRNIYQGIEAEFKSSFDDYKEIKILA